MAIPVRLEWFPQLRPLRGAWLGIALSWHLLAGMLFLRRCQGAFQQPLGPGEMLAATVFVVGVVAAVRGGMWLPRPGRSSRWQRGLLVAPGLAGLLVMASTTLAGTNLLAAILAWGLFTAAETASLIILWGASGSVRSFAASAPVASFFARQERTQDGNSSLGDQMAGEDWEEETLPAGVQQQWARREEEGMEILSGMVRVSFAEGERIQVVHLPLVPPFRAVPEVEASQLTGPDVTLTVTQTETFGIRLEARRGGGDLPAAEAVVQLEVCSNTSAADSERHEES